MLEKTAPSFRTTDTAGNVPDNYCEEFESTMEEALHSSVFAVYKSIFGVFHSRRIAVHVPNQDGMVHAFVLNSDVQVHNRFGTVEQEKNL